MRTFISSSSLLLMTLCTLALSAPTPSLLPTTADDRQQQQQQQSTTTSGASEMITSTSEPIMDTTVLEKLPLTTTAAAAVTATTSVPVTATDEHFTSTETPTSITDGGTEETTTLLSTTTTPPPVMVSAPTETAITEESTSEVLATTTTAVRPHEKSASAKKLKPKETLKKAWSAKESKALLKQKLPETTTTMESMSTSIKTAPTTIKATTLTSTTTTEMPTTTVSGVIVLNSNSSDGGGLIVVDVMGGVGENVTASSFEIKMDLVDEDEIITTTTVAAVASTSPQIQRPASTTASDDIILVNEAAPIKWNAVRHASNAADIKITFDNIDLPRQHVNVSIENGELVIDSIDLSLLTRVEEELRANGTENGAKTSGQNSSLEIVLMEEAPPPPALTTVRTSTTVTSDRKMANDDIKIKTTDKDSDTIFYISNTEVKLIESIPTTAPNDTGGRHPAIYEEDVIVDVPAATTPIVKNNRTAPRDMDKYEEDIVLSPLTSDFDPKDINYIGEAFLDVEESANGGGVGENRHIIPLTSDVVVQPVELKDLPSINIPIIGEPPQIELTELFADEDERTFPMDEFSPFLINSRLVKTELQADEPKSELDASALNGTLLLPSMMTNKTHSINSVNTVINGTNMTTIVSTLANTTAAVVLAVESEDIDNSDMYDVQTLLVACLATLAPLFLIVIIALIIRYCWQKYRRSDGGNDLISDKSTDPLAEKGIDDMKSTESAMSLNRGNGNLQTQSTEMLLASSANGDLTPSGNGCNHSDTNGSIIKMTMKNNHLIVETEERNDISRDTRETKMHYSPSEKDGVFIVEAARGADQNGSHKPSPLLQKSSDAPLEIPDEIKIDTLQSHFTPSSPEEERKHPKQAEQVEVHTPPAEIKACNGAAAKTGLSQSDLSLTSSNSSNQNYTYGDRDAYQYEEKGYRGSSPKRVINVHCHDLKPLIENSPPTAMNTNAPPPPSGDKPVITCAIYKGDSQDDNNSLKSDKQATVNGTREVIANGTASMASSCKMNGIIAMKNGLDEIIAVPDENCNDTIVNGELDSLSYLPAPPPVDESSGGGGGGELMSMDSFPPPPPLES